MSNKKLYRVFIDKTCTKCGICCSVLTDIFTENDIGEISIKQETIYEDILQQVVDIQKLCIVGAIRVQELTNEYSDEKLEKRIKNIIRTKLERIAIREVHNGDCLLSTDEMDVELSIPSIISEYKFLSLESAEKNGAKELERVYKQNAETVLKGAVLKCKYDKIMKFVNREDYNYFFKDFEDELNNIIANINELIKSGWQKDVPYKIFDIDLTELQNYNDLMEFDTSFWIAPNIYGEFSDYVGVDYNSADKWRYEINKDEVMRFFEDVIYKSFDICLDSSVVEIVKAYCADYKEKAIQFINKYKKYVYDIIPEGSKSSIDRTVDFKSKVEKLCNEFQSTKQKVKEGKYVYFDMNWDSDYRFVFRSDARKASENRAERMEREYRQSFRNYADTIAENYVVEITSTINQYLSGIHNLCLEYDKRIKNNVILITLDRHNEIKIDLSDVLLPQTEQDKIQRYVQEVCRDSIEKVDDSILIFTTIDDMEVYTGESIFGRSKFVTKYNYELDNVYKIHDSLRKEHEKLANIIYSKKVTNSIYKKIAMAVKLEVLK